MKNRKLLFGIALFAVVFTSCKDEKEIQALKTVDTYVVYVDSLGNIASSEAKINWEIIESSYNLRMSDAEAALLNLKESTLEQERIEASKLKYEELKANVETEMAVDAADNPNQLLRNSLFGEGKVDDDMNFSWVNKDNIHDVYQLFINTTETNKEAYSREDWDEIKLMYEALDSRKNTVENEGLSSDDNKKIAILKLKFAPMLKMNRIGAKSEEMKNAKG